MLEAAGRVQAGGRMRIGEAAGHFLAALAEEISC
jgi:hypothetical protein